MFVTMQISQAPGTPFPLGATPTPSGTNFAVVTDHHLGGSSNGNSDGHDAHGIPAVQLCLFDDAADAADAADSDDANDTGVPSDTDDASWTERRLPMREFTSGVWHIWVPGVGPGQRYGYRVASTDPAKLLLDPYARQVDRTGYDLDAAATPGVDTAGLVPLGVVTAPVRATVPRPCIPWEHTVIYEAHVRGLTQTHPAVPPEQRGTYAGLAHPAVIDHLSSLGVTAIELLPIHAHTAEPLLAAAGRENYWGYSNLSYFAPHPGYASRPGAEVAEFAAMVDALHTAGIEVLLDVVFNHTCEGGPEQPITLSWRGLAPQTYYLDGNDITGTGNTINSAPLPVVRMVTDSLRYFADDLGVDGFRFDLAPVLGRPDGGAFDTASSLLTAIAADPLLRQRKLIAEPWDATAEGYSLGDFGPDWAEWNDRFRDTVRDFWRGTPGVRDVAYRLTGSEDVFRTRRPWASVNLVTAHDGFTLRDLVSYEHKHNDANGQGGADGTDDNRSANYGIEGDGDGATPIDPAIVAVRTRQARNLAATLMLATGTPMLAAGDEIWRTQHGNNNAYCIDSPQVWLDWSSLHDPHSPASDMLTFFQRLVTVRAAAPALHQGEFFSGRASDAGERVADIVWFAPSGRPMVDDDWFDGHRRTLALWFDGTDVRGHGPHGAPLADDSWLLVLHSGDDDFAVTLPDEHFGRAYVPVLDTTHPSGEPATTTPLAAGTSMTVPGRTLLLLRALPHSLNADR